MLKPGIDPEKLYRATFIRQYGLCCCNMALVSFRLFCKSLGHLREFFGQMVYRPHPWQNISRTPTSDWDLLPCFLYLNQFTIFFWWNGCLKMLFILFQVLSASVKGFFLYALFNLIATVPVAFQGASIGKSWFRFWNPISDSYCS